MNIESRPVEPSTTFSAPAAPEARDKRAPPRPTHATGRIFAEFSIPGVLRRTVKAGDESGAKPGEGTNAAAARSGRWSIL